MKVFSQIQIKHADWPYIIKYFSLYFLLIILAGFFTDETGFFIFLIVLSVFFFTLTQFHLYRLQKNENEYLQYKIQAITELNRLLPLKAPLPPMTGWAATPELAVTIHKHIQIHRPKCIVEIGSGVSTLISAYSLKSIGNNGKVISFDHDEIFAKKSQQNLNLHQLAEVSEIRVSTLKEVNIHGKPWKWYDPEKLTFNSPIDLLIIDGPPVKTQKNARYPALPLLYKHLAEDAVVVMHDTKRPAESDILRQWLKEFPDFESEEEFDEKGITILKRTGAEKRES